VRRHWREAYNIKIEDEKMAMVRSCCEDWGEGSKKKKKTSVGLESAGSQKEWKIDENVEKDTFG
jgi:hypothetical protein